MITLEGIRMNRKEFRKIDNLVQAIHRDFDVSSDDRLSLELISAFIDVERMLLGSIHIKRLELAPKMPRR